jgi:hypothetical protein
MAESNKNRFDDIFHDQNDDADEAEDQPLDFDYFFMNFGKNEQIVQVELDPFEVENRSVSQEQEEQHLSQQFRQLSASVKPPSTGNKRSAITPTTPTTPTRASTATSKKLKTVQEQTNDDVPQYLSMKNKFFERFIVPVLDKAHVHIPIEDLRSMAILKHKLALVHLSQKLWTAYLQSGTGHLKGDKQQTVGQAPLFTWPKELKTRMIKDGRSAAESESPNHKTYLNYVNEKLQQLNIQNIRYQDQLRQQQQQLMEPNFTSAIEKAIDQFVEEHGIILHRLRTEQETTQIEFDYKDCLLDWEFNRENPFQDHVCYSF